MSGRRLHEVRSRALATAGIAALVLVSAACGGDDDEPASGTGAPAVDDTSGGVTTPSGEGVDVDTTAAGATTTAAGATTTSTGAGATTTASSGGGTTTSGSLVEVPTGTMAVDPPIGLDETADFGTGVRAELVDIQPVDGVATGPGMVAGPSLRVEVRVTNDTDETISLAATQVELLHGVDEAPAIVLSGPDVVSFPASVAPGGSATGAYVFNVPLDRRSHVQVRVSYSVEAPIVVFEGAAP